MTRISRRINDCPNVAATLALKRLSGRWKILILRLLLNRPHRYGELKRELADITDKMLTQQLREMEEDNILIKSVIVIEPPKVVQYELTDLGYQARDVVDALTRWGHRL
ncbi:MAG: helix-turn-helix domain-containing protein [Cyanobacteria bacterium J06639_14]